MHALHKVEETAIGTLERKWLPQFLDEHVGIAVRLATEPIILHADGDDSGTDGDSETTQSSTSSVRRMRRSLKYRVKELDNVDIPALPEAAGTQAGTQAS